MLENKAGGSGTKAQAASKLIGSLDNFVPGDDFDEYMERAENFFELNGVEDNVFKRRLIVHFIGLPALKKLQQLLYPNTHKEATYEEVVAKLKSYFSPKRTKIAESVEFFTRKQRDFEKVADYAVELQALSKHCQFGSYLDTGLRNKFIAGIENKKIKGELMNSADEMTFDQAVAKAKVLEQIEEDMVRMQAKGEAVNFVNRRNRMQRDGKRTRGRSGNSFRNAVRSKSRGFRKFQHEGQPKQEKRDNPKIRCFACGGEGHVARLCRFGRNRPNLNASIERETASSESEEDRPHGVNHVASVALFHELSLNGKCICFEVDSGATYTIMSEKDFRLNFARCVLRNCDVQLVVTTGEKLQIKGVSKFEVQKRCDYKVYVLDLLVVSSKRDFLPLLGRNWLDVLYPRWRDRFLNSVSNEAECRELDRERNVLVSLLKSRYADVLTKNLEESIEGFEAEIHLCDDSRPVFFRARDVPFALKEKVSDELDRLVRENVIKPTLRSDWASPLVVVPKSDGSVRLCVDCKVTINKVISNEHYPLPNISDIFAKLSGYRFFAKIDLSGAYMQIKVAESSQKYLTVNTHKGLFTYLRLPFGISSAASTFQRVLEEILKDLEGVQCFLDDILLGGETIKVVVNRVISVFERLKQYKVKVNLDKCEFLCDKISYLGHEISENGLRPNAEKVKAILEVPRPEDVSQLKSYLGMINYYSKFVPNLSIKLSPLYELIKKNRRYNWSAECETVFQDSKKLLVDNSVLYLYDPKLPIVVICDASAVGVGAVLCHVIDNVEKPVFYVSSTLSKAERNYPNLHREALAIVFGLKKFFKYIYGKKITVVTDNKPLVSIFDQKTGIPALAAARLQKYAYAISIFDFDIVYRKGKKIPDADALSRLPVKGETGVDSDVSICSVYADVGIDTREIGRATQADEFYRRLFKCVRDGWSEHAVPDDLKFYHDKVSSLSIAGECLLYCERVIIPSSCRERVLELLHGCHLGMIRMKQMARKYVYWRGMDDDIERFVRECKTCSMTGRSVSKEYSKWPNTGKPFERLHIDFFYVSGKTLFVVIDSYSKWMDVRIMRNTDANSVIKVLGSMFLIFGYCKTIVSDNGPPFGSEVFRNWANSLNITLLKSPP
ncbi:uncharacterized protein K02A2.6-like [Uranotaenia lowii]|uniref:uncharacterized protein K02A2.6-like n=1 Tax=Uranotaenia lowii TaxID=190385 RepID=UPI00247AB07B|nr:uncharacterized protein K02A2.6-like [Uranotaenia lowii]